MSIFKQKELNLLKGLLDKEKKIVQEIQGLSHRTSSGKSDGDFVNSQLIDLKNNLKKYSQNIRTKLALLSVYPKGTRPQNAELGGKKLEIKEEVIETPSIELPVMKVSTKKTDEKVLPDTHPLAPPGVHSQRDDSSEPQEKGGKKYEFDLTGEVESLKKIHGVEEEKKKVKKIKANPYVSLSNKFFSDLSLKLLKKGNFRTLSKDISKAKLRILPKSYVSIILFTTLLAFLFSIVITMFFLFFNISLLSPFFIPVKEDLLIRFAKLFWILFAVPIGTYVFMYLYPTMEKKSLGGIIDQELPFATINMSAISGSQIEPSKIFEIIIKTGEYPKIQKEFTALLNEMNVLGHDLVTALREVAFRSPSKKLGELLNGLATSITSGGDLPEFFNKRAESYLFDYRIEREKYTKMAETFMDIYISVVIAAPMILMLLLMMMKISGFGIPLSTSAITIIMILGVTIVNIGFLTFLSLKQPGI